MKTIKPIFLPGTDRQFKILSSQVKLEGKNILIIGGGTAEIANEFLADPASQVIIIVEDNDSLLQTRLLLGSKENVSVRMMEFANTDFPDEIFDLVYAQASISNTGRNKIIKEVKRILKSKGIFCLGENIIFTKELPQFVKDIFQNSGITPILKGDFSKYYTERNFDLLYEHDLSQTLKDFYQMSASLLSDKVHSLSEQEKSFYKKMIKQMSHESNAYLNLGGENYFGFMMLILQKRA
ncbi:MAG: class I SAM-dependent methyltransferase [Ignavibacteriaceae bacterium]